jgi:hypothetical protein
MGFKRGIIQDAGLSRNMRVGDGSTWAPALVIVAADAAYLVTVADLAAGAIQFTSFSAGRAVTTPTAALILAAFPEMDVGDVIHFKMSCVAAFAATHTAGAGVTLAGRATCPASSSQDILITKTSSTTVTWTAL